MSPEEHAIADMVSEGSPVPTATAEEVLAAEPNEWGCYCGTDELCETCSEPVEVEYLESDEDGGEVKTYPHISEFKGAPVSKEVLRTEQVVEFRSFISRASR